MVNPILSPNEKVAMNIADESVSPVMLMDGTTADDVIRERKINKHNDMVDKYVEKLNEHSAKVEDYAEQIAENIEKIEIMPINNYVLVKQFEENPFQRVVKQGNIITDIGGLHPQYKNTDNGQIEEEEQFIKVGVIQEVGPECKWCKEGDIVFATKPSLVPLPFFKQNLYYLCETRVMAIVNEGLTERFKNAK